MSNNLIWVGPGPVPDDALTYDEVVECWELWREGTFITDSPWWYWWGVTCRDTL